MDWFDGWGFSSGESDVAWSDAQNVDYGFGIVDGFDGDYTNGGVGLDGWSLTWNDDGLKNQLQNLGGTPEVTTNDFGISWPTLLTGEMVDTSTKALQVASNAKNAVSALGQTGKSATKSTTGTKTADVLASFGTFLTQAAGVLNPKQGVQGQKTTAVQQTYQGQLTPSGGARTSLIGGIGNGTLLAAAGILIVGALYIHAKG